jgi:hypothetical protein
VALTRNETPTGTVTRTSSAVRESVTVEAPARGYLLKDPSTWGWSDLRDYVFYEIESRGWPIPERDSKREASVFRRFVTEWQEFAGPIAVHAFTVYDGMWNGAQISMSRFCKNSDAWFAAPILEQLISSGKITG